MWRLNHGADGFADMLRVVFIILVALGLAGLSACTSANRQEVLASAATTPAPSEPVDEVAGSEASENALIADAAATPANAAETQVAALATNAKIRLAPVIGAPSGAVQAMSRRIASRSSERGIGVVPPGTSGATHDMKGYFSAITESGKTTVIFVWDVFDASGNRLHRIQGQESAPGSSPDGWSSVSSRVMENIGTRTVDEFAAWLQSRKNG